MNEVDEYSLFAEHQRSTVIDFQSRNELVRTEIGNESLCIKELIVLGFYRFTRTWGRKKGKDIFQKQEGRGDVFQKQEGRGNRGKVKS